MARRNEDLGGERSHKWRGAHRPCSGRAGEGRPSTAALRSGVAMVLGFYTLLWTLTGLVGTAQVRKVAIDALIAPEQRNGFVDLSNTGRRARRGERAYSCEARAWAPFLVRAEYGWGAGTLIGGGGSVLYIWLPGGAFKWLELDQWDQ